MALNDVYRATAFGTIFGQPIASVFYYQVTGPLVPTDDPAAFAPFWYSNVMGLAMPALSDQVSYSGWLVEDIDDLTKFSEELSTLTGAVAGDCLPAYAAFGFRLRRLTRDSRNGAKRLAGVPESSQVNGVAVPGVIAALTAFATQYGADLTVGGATFSPIIFRRPETAFPVGVPFRSNGADYVRISTQNSRKSTQ
jgi:hypothetical protein